MTPIDVVVTCRGRFAIAIGVGIGVCEMAAGISSRSLAPNRPRNCRAELFAKRRAHAILGASMGDWFRLSINKHLRHTVPDDNFDCVFGDGDNITIQGITLLFIKVGRIKYNLRHVKTSKLFLDVNIGVEISSIKLRVERTR